MKRLSARVIVLGCFLMVGLMVTAIEAATPARTTTITIKMANENCANRITASIREVPNVGEARADVERRIVTVTPAGPRLPSPRALWDAVEKTNHAVVQLEGPQGKFTSKPAN
jgi:copper chaperone CopZ